MPGRRIAALCSLAIAAACGRIGYDPLAAGDAGLDARTSPDTGARFDAGLHDGPSDAGLSDAATDAGHCVAACICTSGQRRVTNAASGSYQPSIAFDGSAFGVVWQDNRAGSDSYDLYFNRVDDRGDPLRGDALVVRAPGNAGFASLVWNGAGYGVAWQEGPTDGDAQIYFAPLDAEGIPTRAAVAVTTAAGDSARPSLVWNGVGYGLAWDDVRDGNVEIYFARIGPGGERIGADVRVTSAAGTSLGPTLVWNGSRYGLAWEDDRSGRYAIYFTTLDASGAIGSEVLVTSSPGGSQAPSLAWTGDRYGLAYDDDRGAGWGIFIQLLDASGARVGPEIPLTTTDRNAYLPSIAWNGRDFVVVWHDGPAGSAEIYYSWLDADGHPVFVPDLPEVSPRHITNTGTVSDWPAVAWGAGRFVVVWEDERDGRFEIYAGAVLCSP